MKEKCLAHFWNMLEGALLISV